MYRRLCNVRTKMYRNFSNGINDFPERSVRIKTCGRLYKSWKKENAFRKLPEGDLTFEVKFIDTFAGTSNRLNKPPTILALHGAPGSWKDYTLLSSFLSKRGCRVIVPSFPDFHTCKPGVFRHSNLEKAQYIKDFLAAISVKDIDLLVCHSGSVYPGLNLCLSAEPSIKSLALLNPVTFNVKQMNITKHFAFMKVFVKAAENPILLQLMQGWAPFFMKNILKVPVRVENVLDPLLSATTLNYGNIKGSREQFISVAQKLPLLYIFSENDVLVGEAASYELAQLFGASPLDVFVYNNQAELVQKGTRISRLKVVAFEEGSHYAFLKHPTRVHEEIADFLELSKFC